MLPHLLVRGAGGSSFAACLRQAARVLLAPGGCRTLQWLTARSREWPELIARFCRLLPPPQPRLHSADSRGAVPGAAGACAPVGDASPVSCGSARTCARAGAADGGEEPFILGSSWLTQETLFIIFPPPAPVLYYKGLWHEKPFCSPAPSA